MTKLSQPLHVYFISCSSRSKSSDALGTDTTLAYQTIPTDITEKCTCGFMVE